MTKRHYLICVVQYVSVCLQQLFAIFTNHTHSSDVVTYRTPVQP